MLSLELVWVNLSQLESELVTSKSVPCVLAADKLKLFLKEEKKNAKHENLGVNEAHKES